MDTDDLSNETYKAVISTSEKFHQDLTLQFGLLSYECATDDDFLVASESMIKRWLADRSLVSVINNIFFENPPDPIDFKLLLHELLHKIVKVKNDTKAARTFE